MSVATELARAVIFSRSGHLRPTRDRARGIGHAVAAGQGLPGAGPRV